MDKQQITAELHTKLALQHRLRTERFKALAAIYANLATTYRLRACRRQYQSQHQILNLNYELQAKHYQLLVELHQERSEQYYLMASESEKRSVVYEELAHYHAITVQNSRLKIENGENSQQGYDRCR